MFNKDTLKHSLLKKQTLAIILILIAGGISSVYATTISDTTSIFQNVTILGTCSGCGAGEGSFSTYSVILNSTIGGTSGSGLSSLQVGTNGTVFVEALNGEVNVIFKDGTVHKSWVTTNAPALAKTLDQTLTGEYQVGEDDFTSQPSIHILKNNNEIQHLFITKTNWSGSNLSTVGLAISSNGQYIAIYGEDSGLASQRLVILQGS